MNEKESLVLNFLNFNIFIKEIIISSLLKLIYITVIQMTFYLENIKYIYIFIIRKDV